MEGKKEEFEFSRVLEIVSNYADSEPAKKTILRYEIAEEISLNHIQDIYEKVIAAKEVIQKGGEIPFSLLKDIKEILGESIMDTSEILIIKQQLDIAERVMQLRKKRVFEEICSRIILMPEIKHLIFLSIDDDGNILDSATGNLNKIRRGLRTSRNRIISKLKKILSDSHNKDNIITQRDGRYTIPIPLDKKGEIDGIVVDTSRKGTTVFLEPYAIVPENNKIRSLEREEREEIHKILQKITSEIKSKSEEFIENQMIIAELDGIFARAKYGIHIDGTIPEFSQQPILSIKKAKHPIIQETRETVSFDIELNEGNRTLLVSGPNTGGKTVLLKSIGLIVNMAYTGIPLPAEEVKLYGFKGIYADIEDKQSIDEGLSTFSSHINRLKEIVNNAETGSLVLLDEPGSGTDPDEGTALAIAILEGLTERAAFVVATTHYEKLKYFVSSQENMLNGAMEFDPETHKPTYRLIIGIPGGSNALEVAYQLGMDKKIINRAKEYLSSKKIETDTLIRNLMKERHITEENKEKYKRLSEQYKLLVEEYENKIKSAKQEAKQIIKSAKESAMDMVKNGRSIIERTIKDIKESQAKREIIKSGKDKIENFLKRNAPQEKTLSVNLKDKKGTSGFTFEKSVPLEINVIGLNREDAWEKVDKFIDDAVLANYENISIVHGLGSGILKKHIRKQLEKDKRVLDFYPAAPEQGGEGVTIIKL